MTDTPGREPEQRLPARREPSEPAPVERFTSPPAARKFELSPARAAQIVRQSSNARWVGFLATIIVVLFVSIYYFYELTGLGPIASLFGQSTEPRLAQELDQQQVVRVERGYNLYQANCARCHGPSGLGPEEPEPPPTGGGYIGPKLNDQVKLFSHLNESYLRNILTVGGRYACGNPRSAMPVWADINGGPLNYRQIEELIAFLRAPADHEFEVRDPELNEPTGGHFRGWVDPAFRPEPNATPYPDCWTDATGGGGGSPTPGASLPPDSEVLELSAANVAFSEDALSAPADAAFGIQFTNDDPGQTHDVDIKQGEEVVSDQPTIADGEETTYVYEGLAAGEYTFFCSVHPFMTGTLMTE
jgi:mono/diheme cytochrome c family protein/plastocyanin